MQVTTTREGIDVSWDAGSWAHRVTVSNPADNRKQLKQFTTKADGIHIPMDELHQVGTVELRIVTIGAFGRHFSTTVTVDLEHRWEEYTIQCMYQAVMCIHYMYVGRCL